MNIERFDAIFREKRSFELPLVKAYMPMIEDGDYERGYITRYFAQKANDTSSPITEIDDSTFTNLIDNSFYIVVDLDWKIIGTKEEIQEANLKSIQLASKKLSTLPLYLPYTLQYSKPN